jgi:CubicO group peptidase (beta-lactamase class C family)
MTKPHDIARAGALALVLFVLTGSQVHSAELPTTAPEKVGFSADRLKRLDAVMEQAVDDKQYGGIVVLLARHGKVVRFASFGMPTVSAGSSDARESIFRISSLSKPLTGAAMMLLNEEGKWSPKDPISKFIPQFASLRVYKDTNDFGTMRTEELQRAPTMLELMTHTAGFSYGGGARPVDQLYRDELGQIIYDSRSSLKAMIERLANVPLLYQPGTRWIYSVSVDIQGYIIEKLSGMTLPDFMKQRLFLPLGMKDTDFYVPKEKQTRFATLYRVTANDKGAVTAEPVLDQDIPKNFPFHYHQEPSLPSGGGGMVTTAADYFRFAQMLLNGGQLNGVRVLAPSSVKLMMSDHLPDNMTADYGRIVPNAPRLGLGFGYGGGVVVDPGKADVPMGKGSYVWDGGFGTWFWADPVNDIVFVGMVNRTESPADKGPPTYTDLQGLSRAVTYQALLHPEL